MQLILFTDHQGVNTLSIRKGFYSVYPYGWTALPVTKQVLVLDNCHLFSHHVTQILGLSSDRKRVNLFNNMEGLTEQPKQNLSLLSPFSRSAR